MAVLDISSGANHPTLDVLEGFSIVETNDTAARVEFRKAVVGGQILYFVNLASRESATIDFVRPKPAEGGVYVKVTGTISGVLHGSGV